MKSEYKLALSVLVVGVLALGGIYFYKNSIKNKTQIKEPITEVALMPKSEQNYEDVEEVRVYLQELQELYKQGKSVLPLDSSELDSNGKIAQDLALNDKEFLSDTKENNRLLHNDITKVTPALQSMLDSKSKEACKESICYVVEKYNFAKNSTTRAIVDVSNKKVVAVKRYPNTQPDINVRLTNIAKAIVMNNEEIINQWGHKPSLKEISMPNVRTNLQDLYCKEKRHLCAILTLLDEKKQKTLSATVDLNTFKLSSFKIKNSDNVFANSDMNKNQKYTIYNKDGWEILLYLNSFNQLELRDIKFNDKKVAKSLQIINKYSDFFYKNILDLQITPLKKDAKEIGFRVSQNSNKEDNKCLQNIFEFYKDGSFKIIIDNFAIDFCSNINKTLLIKCDIDLENSEQFSIYKDGIWHSLSLETKYRLENNKDFFKNRYKYKISDFENKKLGYYIEQFYKDINSSFKTEGSNIYITKFKANENYEALIDKLNFNKVVNEELIEGEDIVVWFAPYVKSSLNDNSVNKIKYDYIEIGFIPTYIVDRD